MSKKASKEEIEKRKQNRDGRPDKWSSPEELQTLLQSYFDKCDEENEPYTITGLCLHLGTTREVLNNWGKDKNIHPKPPEMVAMIVEAKLRCEDWIVRKMLTGKANPIASIFNLKNNHGWKDKSELDTTSNGKQLGSIPITINMPKPNQDDE